jgi:23S rRNA pseudouridine1911/1915/1917 synthase
MKRYVAPDYVPLAHALALLSASASDVAAGRVFVDGKRVLDAHMLLAAGAVVTFAGVSAGRAQAAAPSRPLDVLFDDADLLVASKPAGMSTIPDLQNASSSLLAIAALHVGCAQTDLHPTSRLDRGVSGVVTFARSERARHLLAQAREQGRYQRRYVAISQAAPLPAQGSWSQPIGRARDPKLRMVNGKDSAIAQSDYRVVRALPGAVWLALTPKTGRTHQLRVHAAYAKAPLLGDKQYGGATRLTLPGGHSLSLTRIMLHAACIVIPHPTLKKLALTAPLPDDWMQIACSVLGSEAEVRACYAASLHDIGLE